MDSEYKAPYQSLLGWWPSDALLRNQASRRLDLRAQYPLQSMHAFSLSCFITLHFFITPEAFNQSQKNRLVLDNRHLHKPKARPQLKDLPTTPMPAINWRSFISLMHYKRHSSRTSSATPLQQGITSKIRETFVRVSSRHQGSGLACDGGSKALRSPEMKNKTLNEMPSLEMSMGFKNSTSAEERYACG